MHSGDRLPVSLVGLAGAGKTTIARLVAARRGLPAVDLDARIEGEGRASVAALFAAEGEQAFRDREEMALGRALAGGPCVIACGGGIVLRPRARELLRTGTRTVWLEVSAEVAAARVRRDAAARPLLGAEDLTARLRTLLEQRSGLYAEVAVARVATDDLSPAEVAARVCQLLDADEDAGEGRRG